MSELREGVVDLGEVTIGVDSRGDAQIVEVSGGPGIGHTSWILTQRPVSLLGSR